MMAELTREQLDVWQEEAERFQSDPQETIAGVWVPCRDILKLVTAAKRDLDRRECIWCAECKNVCEVLERPSS